MATVTKITSDRPLPRPGSILNWDTTLETDPKILAAYARKAATLTALALKGYADTEDRPDDREYEIAKECADLTDLLCFVLARELGADSDPDEPKDGA